MGGDYSKSQLRVCMYIVKLFVEISLHFQTIPRQKLHISLKFWLAKDRLQNRKNDLDNLTKPVLDSMKRIGLIEDDSFIYRLDVSKYSTSAEEEVQTFGTDDSTSNYSLSIGGEYNFRPNISINAEFEVNSSKAKFKNPTRQIANKDTNIKVGASFTF